MPSTPPPAEPTVEPLTTGAAPVTRVGPGAANGTTKDPRRQPPLEWLLYGGFAT